MTKEEFIQESSMRNLSHCFSKIPIDDCRNIYTIQYCYEAAVQLANKIYDTNSKSKTTKGT